MTFGRAGASREWADGIAIEALGFLAGDPERLEPFLALSGLDPGNLRKAAAQPTFLAAVLDHMANDESLLLAFAANAGHNPADVAKARFILGGPSPDWGP